MKSIQLKRLVLRNFKGIQYLDIPFTHNNEILGRNKSGKTTTFDAFSWVLFGKNSEDIKDFTIKTIGTTRLDHSVEATLFTDREITFTKIYREKWTKKRGEIKAEFSGHETECMVNGVPVSAGDYAKEIDSIISENTFKLLTNPFYFNSLAWAKKRELLFSMAGELKDEVIASVNPDFTAILNREPNLEKLKRELASKKALISKTLKEIPTRISEVQMAITEDVDVDSIKTQIAEIDTQIASIDAEIADSNKANQDVLNRNFQRDKQIMDIRTQLLKIEGELRSSGTTELTEYTNKLNALKNKINQLQLQEKSWNIDALKQKKEVLERDIVLMREKLDKEDARQIAFDDLTMSCPVCKQPLPQDNLERQKEELTQRFNAEKVKNKTEITRQGLQMKADIESLEKSIADATATITKIKEESTQVADQLKFMETTKPEVKQVDIASDPRYIELQDKIKLIESEKETATVVSSDLATKKKLLFSDRDNLMRQMTINDQNQSRRTRIAELEAEESSLAIQIAAVEKDENTIAEFTKVKIDAIEKHINAMFTMVTFKMYEQLINGGEEETCVTLVDGVPFDDANRAGKINAGIDIINTFSRYYGVTCPIWIDNAEAVNDVIFTPSQLIKLIVTRDEKLIILNN